MRIGMFTDTYPPYINGVSTSILMLKNALEKKGHQVFVVTVNNQDMKYRYEENNSIIRIPGLPIGIYDYRLTGIYPVRAVNKIKKWNLDVIHSHTEFGVGTFARIIAKQYNIPLVHTYHTMYEDYIYYITKGYFDGTSKKVVEYLTNFYCDKTTSELVVPTKKTYDLFKEKYKLERNIHIVPTGIEVERFYKENIDKRRLNKLKRSLNLSENDFVCIYVGRIAREKSVDILIDNHREIIKKNSKVKLLIIGDGPDLEKFKKKIQNYKLEDNILFLGKKPWEDIPLYYHLAQVFVTASITETQGLTVIEAMGASCVPICIKDESFNFIIDDLNGKIFRNKREYIKIINDFSKENDSLIRLKKQARITADTYSSKYFAEKMIDVYQEAIKNKPKTNLIVEFIKKGIRGNKE